MNKDQNVHRQIPAGYAGDIPPDFADDCGLWMSLALDGRLLPAEREQLHALVNTDPRVEDEWALWELLDQQFQAADSVTPKAGFSDRVMYRLLVSERRRKLRLGAMIALTYVLLWGAIAIGIASLGMLLFWTRPEWLADMIVVGRAWMVSMDTWLGAIGSTIAALLATPQVRGAGLLYIVVSMLLLFGWTRLLRYTMRSDGSTKQV